MKTDAIELIYQKYTGMTESSKKLADYIISNYTDAMVMSVQELSKNAGVSSAAAIRFAQHLGFNGYSEFRLYLAQNQPEHQDFILDLKGRKGTMQEQVDNVINSSIEAMRLTAQELDFSVLEKAASAIKSAERILLFGEGTSYIVCNDSARKFERLGKTAIHTCETHTAAATICNFGENDFVIGISHSGESQNVCKVLNLARAAGIKTLAVTTFAESPICKEADMVLLTKTRESPLHKIAITSRVSQFAVMDSLVMAVLVSDYDRCMAHIEKLSEYIKKI